MIPVRLLASSFSFSRAGDLVYRTSKGSTQGWLVSLLDNCLKGVAKNGARPTIRSFIIQRVEPLRMLLVSFFRWNTTALTLLSNGTVFNSTRVHGFESREPEYAYSSAESDGPHCTP